MRDMARAYFNVYYIPKSLSARDEDAYDWSENNRKDIESLTHI